MEETKMMKPQEHIDLSLKLMKRTGVEQNVNPVPVRRIEVAEIESSVVNDRNHATKDQPLQQFHNQPMPMHLTRAAKKMLSIQVSKCCHILFA